MSEKKFAKGFYTLQNPQKYVGTKKPLFRSSWEMQFMRFADTNDSVIKWASEAIAIPYKDPLTNRNTIYVPDFFIQYVDKTNKINVELIEIKPASQTLLEKVGRNKVNQAQYIKNQAKWSAANIWCRQQGIKFRVLTENDLFMNGKS